MHLTPRHRRLLLALMAGQCTREEVDRIAGASNGPDEIFRLRRVYRLTLPCVRRGSKDMDGRPVEYGVYSLTSADRAKVVGLLATAGRCHG